MRINIRAIFLLIAVLISVLAVSCTSLEKTKSRIERLSEDELQTKEKVELIHAIIANPDSLETFIKSSQFYSELYSETFFRFNIDIYKNKFTKDEKKVYIYYYKYLINQLKESPNQSFELKSNERLIIGPNEEDYEVFDKFEFIDSKTKNNIYVSFILVKNRWYFITFS